MKVGIFNSTWDSLGGGERYTAAFARFMAGRGNNVEIWWPKDLRADIDRRFAIRLPNTVVFKNLPFTKLSFLKKMIQSTQYDLIFWVSDGSVPWLLSKKAIIHFQIPLHDFAHRALMSKLKLLGKTIVCNSRFTKQYVDAAFGINSCVVYPPVEIELFKPGRKTNTIISVARISRALHAKRQDVLIEAFSQMASTNKSWRLVFTGGCTDPEYLDHLQKMAEKLPIDIIPNPSGEQIRQMIGKSKIFWSATGIGVDVRAHPEKVEHFGITPVEAMAAKCVPVVLAAGGHLETVENDISGLWWNTPAELIENTQELIDNPDKLAKMALAAQKRSTMFSREVFEQSLSSLL